MWFYRLEGRIVKLVVGTVEITPANERRDGDSWDSSVTVYSLRSNGRWMGMLAIRTGLTNIKCCLLK
jgi:hypothetical protein